MTAVASAPVMSNRDSGTETGTEHSPSRFTAVNGRDSTATGPNAGNPPPSAPMNGGERGAQPAGQETQDVSRVNPGDRDDQSERSSPSTYTHKRKRSESGEQESRYSDGYRRGSLNHPGDAPPSNGVGSGSVSEIEPSNSVAASGRSDTNEASQPANGPWPEYESQLINQAQRAQQMDASDAQLADALQREAHSQEPRTLSCSTPSASGVQPASSPVYHAERPAVAVQVAPKRKRVFSNRTKTGCMTCRRRKKKCDEQHPACNNCIRGGFLCEGYNSRSTWQKPSSSKAPVPLQSKEGYPDIGGQYLPETTPQHDRQSGLPEHIESRKMKPIVIDDSQRSGQQYNTSPTGTGSSHAWAKRAWTGAGHSPYVSEHVAKPDFREIPPIHELPREGPPKPDYPVVPPIRELSHGAHPKSHVPLFQPGVEHRPLPPATMDTSSPQAQARMALSIEHQLTSRAAPVDETEKGKMIRGELYRPFDVQLMEERDRCKSALWRFNNACNPLSGLSSKEQNRLLKEILVPPSSSLTNSPSGGTASRLVGSIGQGTVVEAPFNCHYGYNIQIEADVMISQNCLFVDDCGIKIGANTWIGPNVTLVSSMAHGSLQERKGPQTRYQGLPIKIEQDCYIGAGSVICPGVTVGRGAYVGPGEVVKYNVPSYTGSGQRLGYM